MATTVSSSDVPATAARGTELQVPSQHRRHPEQLASGFGGSRATRERITSRTPSGTGRWPPPRSDSATSRSTSATKKGLPSVASCRETASGQGGLRLCLEQMGQLVDARVRARVRRSIPGVRRRSASTRVSGWSGPTSVSRKVASTRRGAGPPARSTWARRAMVGTGAQWRSSTTSSRPPGSPAAASHEATASKKRYCSVSGSLRSGGSRPGTRLPNSGRSRVSSPG